MEHLKPPPPTDQELDDLIRGYSDDQLREQYARAMDSPGKSGKSWHKLLGAEMRRRGLES